MRDWIARAKARKTKLDLSNSKVDEMMGRPSGSYRDMVDRGVVPSIDNARSLAKALGYTLQELFDGNELRLNLFIHGITKGDSMWAEVPSRQARVVPITLASENMVSVEISPEDAAPHLGFREGDIISGEKIPYSDNIREREVIALTKDGRRLMGTLYGGSKRDTVHIRPFKLGRPEIKDVVLEWVAPIQFIVRGPF